MALTGGYKYPVENDPLSWTINVTGKDRLQDIRGRFNGVWHRLIEGPVVDHIVRSTKIMIDVTSQPSLFRNALEELRDFLLVHQSLHSVP